MDSPAGPDIPAPVEEVVKEVTLIHGPKRKATEAMMARWQDVPFDAPNLVVTMGRVATADYHHSTEPKMATRETLESCRF